MDSKSRILSALDNQRPDKVPIFELQIDEPVILRLAQCLGFGSLEPRSVKTFVHGEEDYAVLDLYCRIVQELGLDSTCSIFSAGIDSTDGRVGKDKYGCLYVLSEHGEPMVFDGPIKHLSDLPKYDMISRLTEDDFARVRYVIDKIGQEKAHFLAINDPFKISWLLCGGMEILLMNYILNPELVRGLASIATEFCHAEIDMAHKLGVDVIIVEGDLAGEKTTLMSPNHYREFIKPYHAQIVEYAHQRGLKIVKHSDGNVWPILDDLVEVGFDGFHPIQPQCMGIAEVKRYVGDRICLIGNIDCRYLLPFGTPEEVDEAVRMTIEIAAPGGGYIISSSNSIHAACKAENYIAMIQAAHKYGRYIL